MKGNPTYPRTNKPNAIAFSTEHEKLQLEEVDQPYYGSIMIRSDNGIFADGNTGHFAFVVGKVGGGWNMKTLLPNPISYAQLGGNQAVPGSSSGTTVNVVLRGPASNVKYYHYTFLPKVSLMGSLFQTATTEAQQQLGTDR